MRNGQGGEGAAASPAHCASSPSQRRLELATNNLDLRRIVTFTPIKGGGRFWRVTGGDRRWRDRVGQQIGVLDVKNARAFAVVLLFDDNAVMSFNPIDLYPAPKP